MDSLTKKQLKEKISSAKQHFQSGDFDRSEFEFKRSLEISDEPESYFYLGLLANQKKLLDKALSYNYKAFELNPDYGNPCNEIGVILLRLGRDKDAVFWL
ncbi:MAG: hypothetical protein K8R21_16140, partial [Leptospira sp.]|nr:hypothetical protein [Leptospira sp.]